MDSLHSLGGTDGTPCIFWESRVIKRFHLSAPGFVCAVGSQRWEYDDWWTF